MNNKTADKLRNNPHYKPNEDQQAEINQVERKPMVEFGAPNIHNNDFEKHQVKTKKKKRIDKSK